MKEWILGDTVTNLQAIMSLAPGSAFKLEDDEKTIVYFRNRAGIAQPTEEEIDTERIRLQAEYDADTYARNRQADYPDWGDQLNKIYDDGLTKWKSEMVDPVKTKWPKDNSGPVE